MENTGFVAKRPKGRPRSNMRKMRDTMNKTILFPRDMFERIQELADRQGTSFNKIVTDIVISELEGPKAVTLYEQVQDDIPPERRTCTFKRYQIEKLETLAMEHNVTFNRLIRDILKYNLGM